MQDEPGARARQDYLLESRVRTKEMHPRHAKLINGTTQLLQPLLGTTTRNMTNSWTWQLERMC